MGEGNRKICFTLLFSSIIKHPVLTKRAERGCECECECGGIEQD